VRTGRLLLALVPLAVVPVFPAAMGSAASCRVMTLRYDLSSGQLVVLDPAHYDIPFDGCVQFVNQTAATATISVGSSYSQQLGPNENTSGAANYRGRTPGRQSVTATSGPAGNTAHGSITVGAAPKPAPQPSPHQSKTAEPNPAPSAPPSSAAGTGPQVAPTPTRVRTHHHRHRPGRLQPPVSPPGPVQLPSPSVTPAPQRTRVVAAPIEPASGRATGLPAALAALTVVGSGAALVRVLAAEPVDDRKIVGGGS